MTHVTCRLTAKNRISPTLGNPVWATFLPPPPSNMDQGQIPKLNAGLAITDCGTTGVVAAEDAIRG